MVKGYQKNKDRLKELSFFGKTLVRRSSSSCELCQESQLKLSVFEVPPSSEEPNIEECIFICETCQEQIEKPKKINSHHWRCLQETIWSETPAIQVISLRILRKLASQADWASKTLEEAYVAEDIEEWAQKAEL